MTVTVGDKATSVKGIFQAQAMAVAVPSFAPKVLPSMDAFDDEDSDGADGMSGHGSGPGDGTAAADEDEGDLGFTAKPLTRADIEREIAEGGMAAMAGLNMEALE